VARKKHELVFIEWANPCDDWPWFYLLETNGDWLRLRGADFPDGSAKHGGDEILVHRSEIKSIKIAKKGCKT